jgi:hypothetical protein
MASPRARFHGFQIQHRRRLHVLHGANRDVPLTAVFASPSEVIHWNVLGPPDQLKGNEGFMPTGQDQALNAKVCYPVLAAVIERRTSSVDFVVPHEPKVGGFGRENKEGTFYFLSGAALTQLRDT